MDREPFAAKFTSIWLGGFIFWILGGFKKNIKNYYRKEYEARNLVVGYIITLFVAVVIIILFL